MDRRAAREGDAVGDVEGLQLDLTRSEAEPDGDEGAEKLAVHERKAVV